MTGEEATTTYARDNKKKRREMSLIVEEAFVEMDVAGVDVRRVMREQRRAGRVRGKKRTGCGSWPQTTRSGLGLLGQIGRREGGREGVRESVIGLSISGGNWLVGPCEQSLKS